MTRPVPITLGESPETQAERGLQAFFKDVNRFSRGPSPSGRGCREAAGEGKIGPHPALRATFSQGRRTRPESFLLSSTPLVIDRPYGELLLVLLVLFFLNGKSAGDACQLIAGRKPSHL